MSEKEFVAALKEIKIDISSEQLNQLEQYYSILVEENKKYNLTSIVAKDQVYLKHFYDSACVSKIIDLNQIQDLCDIGSGAGFPGIVLKILFPHLKLTIIESLSKRVKFLHYLINAFSLEDVVIINKRAEDCADEFRETFDLVVSRALSEESIFLELGIALVKVNAYILVMKGKKDNIDRSKIIKILKINKLKEIDYFLPIENSDRTLKLYQKQASTPKGYPREFKLIKKNSL